MFSSPPHPLQPKDALPPASPKSFQNHPSSHLGPSPPRQEPTLGTPWKSPNKAVPTCGPPRARCSLTKHTLLAWNPHFHGPHLQAWQL